MEVISTRDSSLRTSALDAVLKGIAEDGGLFVPSEYPELDLDTALNRAQTGYDALCAYVLGKFFDLSEQQLLELAENAYASFDVPEVVPIRPLDSNEYVMELTHGPTLAFKDMALQVLPRLTACALEQKGPGQDVLILTATSGDTGKAALEGFRDVPRTAIFVFYPVNGVASMQKLQMVTQEGKNTGVCAVEGNFDDAQTGVKKLFGEPDFRKRMERDGYTLSSANSINIGRLAPQVAYYVYAWAHLVNSGRLRKTDKLSFCVPTGNFGNILAAYYAKQMGVPVGRLICASNSNNVLTDFFRTGGYDANRAFHRTMSPSMDILVSSNLERLLFDMSGRSPHKVKAWMAALAENGSYKLEDELAKKMQEMIWADYATEEETALAIRETFREHGYLMDPHTAVAQSVFRKYRMAGRDEDPVVTVSTANPYKFTSDVLYALTGEKVQDAFLAARRLSDLTKTAIPPQIADLKDKPVLHDGVVDRQEMGAAVEEFVGRLSK